MDRQLAVAAGTGSLSLLLPHLTTRAASDSAAGVPLDYCPPCIDLRPEDWDLRSILLGFGLGLAAGPIIDFLYWLRVAWRRNLSRILGSWLRLNLYKVHEH